MDTSTNETQGAIRARTGAEADPAGVRDFPVPLISGSIAVLRVPFPMSEDDFEQLDTTLHAWKKALVKTDVPPLDPSAASGDEEAIEVSSSTES